jgi:hypothetical protein
VPALDGAFDERRLDRILGLEGIDQGGAQLLEILGVLARQDEQSCGGSVFEGVQA